jgi:hypothetical protein
VGNRRYIYVVIKKQIQLIMGKKCLISIVGISYRSPQCSSEDEMWIENMILLEDGIKEEMPLSYAVGRGLEDMVKRCLLEAASRPIQRINVDERHYRARQKEGIRQ